MAQMPLRSLERNCCSRGEDGWSRSALDGAFLLDPALVQEHRPRRHVAGEADLVGDDQHRPPFLGEVADDLQHLADELGIERRGGLVEEHDIGLHRERAGDRRPLLLPAREMGREVVVLVLQPDLLQQGPRPLHRFAPGQLEHVDGRLDDVLQHRQMRPQVELLEHHAEAGADAVDLAPVGRHRPAAPVASHADQLAADMDLPGVRDLQQVDAAQQCTLAGAAGAQDGDDVVLVAR